MTLTGGKAGVASMVANDVSRSYLSNKRRLIDLLQRLPCYKGQILHCESIPARHARYAPLLEALPPLLTHALRRAGIPDDRLYSHQG
jgi:ATP-dependent helicase YprA (DUF1998 family)